MIAHPPPAQSIGLTCKLRLGELINRLFREQLHIAVTALVQHNLRQPPQILRVGKQTGMSGNAVHRIESFFIMNFALNRISAVNGKGNRPVAGISVQLGRRALILFKSLLQRIENDVIEACLLYTSAGWFGRRSVVVDHQSRAGLSDHHDLYLSLRERRYFFRHSACLVSRFDNLISCLLYTS